MLSSCYIGWDAPALLRARGYDLSARNPYPDERAALPRPVELTARLLERQREVQAALERLHALVSNGEEE